MNRQQVLVALLEQAAQYPHQSDDAFRAVDDLVAAYQDWADSSDQRLEKEALLRIGGAVVAQLVTENEKVVGRALDEWLAAKEHEKPRHVCCGCEALENGKCGIDAHRPEMQDD